jgi:hypothetical protein
MEDQPQTKDYHRTPSRMLNELIQRICSSDQTAGKMRREWSDGPRKEVLLELRNDMGGEVRMKRK